MPKTWAISGVDLHVDLEGPRVRAALEAGLRDAVSSGRLRAGTRLPSSRALAADLGIARNTVADAYGQLAAEGWLTARTGAGTWVTETPTLAAAAAPVAAAGPPASTRFRYDLRPGAGDLSAFPRREWLAAARRALARVADHVLDYPDPRGLAQLREALAGYLARARGVDVAPDRIVVCAGFTHGLGLLARALRARGASAVAVESHGLPEHRAVIAGAGLRRGVLPVESDGAVPDRTVLGGAGAALLTPAHQFPLGVTLAPARRRVLTEWAADTGAVLIEDDYDGEFRYDRHPVGAMQALAPDHVVYGGTASKALVPGLRLGWLAVPARLLDEVVTAARLAGGGPDAVSQLTLAEFIASGGYDRQVRHARLAYRRRRDELVSSLSHGARGVRVAGIAAGLHALVQVRPGQSEAEAVAAALRRDLAVAGLADYADGQPTAGLVVGYARPPEHAFAAALTLLRAALYDH